VLLDIPPYHEYRGGHGWILWEGKLRDIEEVSPLVGILRKTQLQLLDISLYAPKEHLGKFENISLEAYLT
jgi:hypothetical protein